MIMRDWLSIPAVHNAVLLLAAGIIIPLIVGILTRIFLFRQDKDATESPPAGSAIQDRVSAVPTPESEPVTDSWPEFDPSPRSPSR